MYGHESTEHGTRKRGNSMGFSSAALESTWKVERDKIVFIENHRYSALLAPLFVDGE